MIVAEGLSKSYDGQKAIDGVSFRIDAGEIVGLLGLNGAGKSTILKILGCFLLPSSGRAEVAGFSVEKNPELIRRVIGYLPDKPPLYDEMTVDAYLSYVARLKNVSGRDVSSFVEHAKSATGLTDVSHTALGELSHGFRQRVGIAQAIVHKPKVIILDEPINGLDPVQIVEMRDLITSLRGKHTVILSSHILSEITKTCDRVLVVDQGQLVAEGSEASLATRFASTMEVLLEVQGTSDSYRALLAGIPNVLEVQSEVVGQVTRLTVRTNGDQRVKLARALIEKGAELSGIQRSEGGLESVFMRLVRGAEGKRHG